jgi:hypothetical protein
MHSNTRHPLPAGAVRLALTGAGSAITIAAASAAWLRLSLQGVRGAAVASSKVRVRRGRQG